MHQLCTCAVSVADGLPCRRLIMEHHEKRKKRRNVANEHSRGTLRTGVRRRQGTTSSHSIAQSRSQKRRADYVEPGSTKRRKKGNSTPATDFEVTTDCFGANSNLAEAEKSDAPLLGGAERGCEAEYEVRMQRFRTIVDYCLARQLKLSPGDVSQLKGTK